ncbi:PEP-CTERM-box response regulator transcription factor [Aestuariispira insulae]|uniref:Two-component system NtrC family response regulator n=1 Tax=Aestuariispira insulae TaxID=1461337 RepID=A0A3D9HK36_9PROT|nr:PEP-CTERM-box response regulator transcription factor [Aestuariispira insulae]RED49867.1 two-component system NtrC family response regulator [Aestuariispira insulae]
MGKLLLVEDDAGLRSQLRWALEDHDVFVAGNQDEAMAVVRKEAPQVVILDLGLPPDPDGATEGLATLKAIQAVRPETKVIVSSGNEEKAHALKAIELGAYDFYPKPVDLDVLQMIIRRAVYLSELEKENRKLAKGTVSSPLNGVIAASAPMLKLCRTIERVAKSDVNVLLTGESGTGKEVLAQAIHEISPRSGKPFIAINCAAIPENLLESELFGHEKGAFTGAIKRTIGKVEQADGGTLFLDEIGDMPISLQAKMLRFLQDRTFERVGGRVPIEVDVHVVSATNRKLERMIQEETFREDLFYRLNDLTVEIPPLREREGDAILLARYFMNKYSREFARSLKGFTERALAAINAYGWPGNVRELESKVKRSIIMADDKFIDTEDLGIPEADDEAMEVFPTLREVREDAERDLVLRVLASTKNNVSVAAKILGVSRPTLYDLMSNLGLER